MFGIILISINQFLKNVCFQTGSKYRVIFFEDADIGIVLWINNHFPPKKIFYSYFRVKRSMFECTNAYLLSLEYYEKQLNKRVLHEIIFFLCNGLYESPCGGESCATIVNNKKYFLIFWWRERSQELVPGHNSLHYYLTKLSHCVPIFLHNRSAFVPTENPYSLPTSMFQGRTPSSCHHM